MIPRLSGAAVVVATFFVAALLPRATWPLTDPDVWWHIRAGELILSTGSVPRIDTWSLTASGHPWTSQDWLANVLLALGERLGPWGETLLSLASAALVAAAFVFVWRAMAVRLPSIGWLSRVAWLSVALLLAGPTLGVRVQVFDLLLTALVLLVLGRYLARGHAAELVALPVIAVAWVNLHAGWPLLFLLGGATVVGEVVDRWRGRPLAPAPLSWARTGILVVALLASAAALVLNPNGTDIYRYPIDTLRMGTLKAAIGEWQPARLDTIFGQLLVAFIVLAAFPTVILAWRRMRTADLLTLVGLTAMAVLAVRFLLVLGPVGGAIVAINLGPTISRSRLGQRSGSTLAGLGRSRRDPILTVLLALVVVLGGGLVLARSVPPAQSDELAKEQPVAATAWLKQHDVGTRVFNRYEWGGYLGFQMPRQPIFIDGRADVYGDAIIAQYVETIGLERDPQRTFDRYHIDHVIFPPATPLASWLDGHAAWKRAYADPVAVIWVRAD